MTWSVTMRQSHIGGDKLFVDYAGDTVPVIVDRLTGQVRAAQIFVAVMGSNITYAEATGHGSASIYAASRSAAVRGTASTSRATATSTCCRETGGDPPPVATAPHSCGTAARFLMLGHFGFHNCGNC